MNTADIAEFIHHEAALLDDRRLEEWLDLFAADGVLWVPGRSGAADPSRHVSIIYDEFSQLRARVTRLLSGKESSQDPPSRTIRSVTNLRWSVGDDGLIAADVAMVIYETRALDAPLLILPSRVRYLLRSTEVETANHSGFRIVEKRLDLLEVHRHFNNLAFLL